MRLYGCRGTLRRPLLSPRGGLLLPAFPELLQRPLKRRRKEETSPPPSLPDFERRRADGIEAVIRTLLAIVACTDWVTMEVLDPKGGFLSVRRLAELACLPLRMVEPSDEEGRLRCRHDRTERALRVLRTAGIIAFTKQHREQLADGSYTSTAPALRKLAVGLFRKFGGHLLRLFDRRRKKLKVERERMAPTTGDLRVAELVRDVGRRFGPEKSTMSSSLARGGPVPGPSGRIPEPLIDAVHGEHPDWAFSAILVEARRRLERGPPPDPAPAER